MSVVKIALKTGKSVQLTANDGAQYKIEMADGSALPKASVSIREGDDLVIRYADGSTVVLRDFYQVAAEVDLDGGLAQKADVVSGGDSPAPANATIVDTHGDRASVADLLASNSALQQFADASGGGYGALGLAALVPLAMMGGGSSSEIGSTAPDPTTTTTIRGSVVAGPVATGNDLIVNVYSAEGILLNSAPVALDNDGQFEISAGGHVGPAIVIVTNSGTAVGDYWDEATGTLKDLDGAIFTATTLTEGANVINVNPLTTLAGLTAGITLEAGVPRFDQPLTPDTIATATQTIAEAFGLPADIITGAVAPTLIIDATGAVVENPNPNNYGAVLAALSGLDAQNGGGLSGLAAIQEQISETGLSPEGQAMLVVAADSVSTIAMDRSTIIALFDDVAQQNAVGLGDTISSVEIADLTLLVAASLTAAQIGTIEDLSALSPEMIAVLSPAALAAISIDALSPAQLGALGYAQVLEMVAAGAFDLTNGSVVALLAGETVGALPVSLIQALTPDDVEALSASHVLGMISAQLLALTPVQIAALTPAAIVGLTPADVAALTNIQVAALTSTQAEALAASGDLAALIPTQIVALSPAAIDSVPAPEIGALSSQNVDDLSTAQLLALTAGQLTALGAQGVTAENLDSLRIAIETASQGTQGLTSTAELVEVVMEHLDNVAASANVTADGVGALTPAVLASVSTEVIAALTPTHIETLSPEQLAALTPVQIAALTPAAIVGLTPADVAALTNIQVAALTSTQAEALAASGDLAALTPTQIVALSPAAIDSVPAPEIGALSSQNVDDLSTAQLLALTPVQIAALTPAAIVGLTPTDVAALTNIQVAALTSTQAEALAASGDLAALTPTQIVALSPAAIDSVPAPEIGALSSQNVDDLSTAQLLALTAGQLTALGAQGVTAENLDSLRIAIETASQGTQGLTSTAELLEVIMEHLDNVAASANVTADGVGALTPAVLASVSTEVIAALTPTHIETLSPEQLAALTPVQIAALTPAAIVGLTPADVAALTNIQVAALTSTQADALAASGDLAALTPTQIVALSPAAIDSVPVPEIGALSSQNVDDLSTAQLLALTPVQIAALTPAAIVGLTPADVAALTNIQVAALTSTQAEALAASGDLAALIPTQIVALSPAAIDSVPAPEIGALSSQNVDDLSTAQLLALTAGQLTALGAQGVTAENLDSLRIAIETASQGTQGLTSTTELLEVIAEQVSLGGGGDGGASQPFSETEALAAIQEFLSANGPGDRDEMISAIGTLFPNADVSTPYAYEFGLRSGMYADRTNPTTSEIQTIVENVPNILNSALAELAEDIAGDANGMPFGGFEVYLLSPGDTLQIDYAAGLLDGTLYADPGNPTLAEVQDQIVAQSEAYVETQLQALADLIAGGDASAFDPQPYVNFAPEFGQYIFNNIPDFRDALIDPSNYADPSQPTIAEIVAISAEIKSIGVANTLAEIAEDIAGNSNGQLVMVSDLFAISYPFNNGNSDQFVQSIIDPTHYADPANPTEEEVTAAIQASSTAVGLVLTKLTSVIAGTTPTSDFSVEDLTALTTGVEPDKMDDYLAAVLDPVTPWYGTPNAYQISDLVIQVNAGTYGSNSGGPNPGGPGSSGIDAVLAALAEDIAGNADNNHVASWQLTQAGFEYLSNDYWNDYQAELLDSNNYADAENPTEEEVQAVIFAVNEVILVSILPTLATELASDYPNSGILRTFSEIVEGSAPEFEAQYSNVIFDSNNYADIAAPTAAEVRAVLQTVNSAMDRILASVTATLIDGEPQGTISLADMQAVTAHAPPESLQAFTDRVFATTNYNLDSPGYILGDFAIATTVSNVDVAFRGLAEIALRTSGDPAAMDHFNEVSFDFALLRAGLVNEVTDFEGWYATMVLDPSHYSDPNAPTFVEVQAVIDTGNQVLAPIFDRIMDVLNGNADASTFALADLQALSDQVTAENADFYREQIFDADRYNGNLEQYVFHRVMDGTTAVDTALDALDELAASINQIDGAAFNYGNDLAPVLARIDNSLQYAYEGILRNEGNYVDTLHPTLAEAQAAIDHFNSMPAVVAEIQEDVAGNANGNLVSLAQLQSVSPEINADWLSEYQTTLASGNYYLSGGGSDSYNSLFDAIDQVNETQALAALADDLTQQVSTGFTGDFVRMAAENTDPDLLSSYLTALHDGTNFADTANPTAAEVQAIVDQVNAQLVQASLIEDMSGNQDGMHLEADQLQRVIDNAQTANLDLYLDALADPAQYADANAPLVSEMQAVVDDINLEVSQDQQLTVLGYHFTGPDATSFLYRFDQTNLEDLVPGLANDFRENYLSRILDETNYADPANPTLAEVQGLIDAANAEIDAVVAELFEDHDGNANAELVTAAQLSVLSDTINPDDLSYHQAAIDSYIAAVTPETVDLEHVVNIIRGVDQDRDAYRASMIELVEDIAGNQNAVPVTISDLRNLADNAGLYKTLVNNSWAGTIMPALIDASNYADPAAPTDQEIHTIVDTQITQAFIADLPNQVSPSDLPFQVLRQKFSILDLDGFSQFVTSPYNNSYDSGLNDSIQAQVYLSHNYADPDSPTLDEIEAATLLGWRNFVYAEVVDAGTAELDTWHALGLTNLTADTLAAFETEFFGLYTKTIEIAQDKADFYTALYALADGTANAGTALNADTVTTDVFGAAYNPQNWSADLTAQATIPTLLNDIYDRLDFDAVDTKAERSDWATAIWSKSFSVDQYQALGFADVTAGNLGELNTRVFRLPPSEPGGSNVYVDVFGNPNIPYPETTHVPTIAGITDDLAAVLDPITVDISADSTTLAQDYGTYTVTFSEAVTGFGLEDIMVNLQDLNPSYTLSDFTAVDGSTYTFRINDMFGFDGNTTVWLDVDGMSGSEGQGILGSERTHTISVTEEIRVISTSVDGSGDLQAGDDIVLNFNDYMATANISGTIESSIYLTDVTSGTTTVYEASDRFGSIQSDEIDISGSTLTINPVGDLIVGHNYTLSLGAHAIQGDQNDAIQTPVNTYDEDAGIYDYQLSFAVI